MFNKNFHDKLEEKDEEKDGKEKEDIAEEEGEDDEDGELERGGAPAGQAAPVFPFPLGPGQPGQDGEASKNLQELLQRQLQFPGIINPLMGFPGLAGPPPGGNQQFQGLFNMFLSEMLKKVSKETPPQTPPSSPPPADSETSS